MKRSTWQIALVLVLFVLVLLKIDSSSGTDLTASFVSCRLVLAGDTSHLYSHDPTSFNLVSDPIWWKVAKAGGCGPHTLLTPFVQTPLWPYFLQPVCGWMRFSSFNELFKVVLAVCFAALIWITGRYWTTRFFKPSWVLFTAILWVRADPLREAMELTQTHVIFVLLSVLAILFSRSNRPIWAGALMAIAAAVKITPGAFLVYWLLTRQRKAALSFVLASVALFLSTVLLAGRPVTIDYLHSMERLSNILLLARSNQSVAAWWAGLVSPPSQPLTFQAFHLPRALQYTCSSLIVLSAVAGARLDRRLEAYADSSTPPLGAIFTLLGATVFAPIAWSHYYLILVVPLILVMDAELQRRSYTLLCLFALIVGLANSPNLLRHAGYLHLPVPGLIRGQFYAGLLAMGALYLIYRRQMETRRDRGSSAPGVNLDFGGARTPLTELFRLDGSPKGRRGSTCTHGRTAPESG